MMTIITKKRPTSSDLSFSWIATITNMHQRHTVKAARENFKLNTKRSRVQLKQTLISIMVTSNFILFNKTSTSKPLLTLNKNVSMKEIKSGL